jgi:tetratricopeptide (TPR) repeat protein
VAWSCALGPGALADFTPAIALAQQAAASDASSAQFANSLGAILYRAGRFDEACQKLDVADHLSSPDKTRTSPAYTWFFLAMAHQRLGHAVEAKQWLDKARQETETALKRHEAGTEKLPWNRRLSLTVLRNEAEELFSTKSAPAEPAAITATNDEGPVEAKKP